MAENGYAKPVLVTTDWLVEHLNDDSLVVAEVDENPTSTTRATSLARSSCTGATTSRIRSSATSSRKRRSSG
jgi:hypothetical protein